MKDLMRLVIGSAVTGLIVVGGCMGFFALMPPETKLKVTIENRTDQPLTDGSYGLYYSALAPAEPPLDHIAPHSSVTHILKWPGVSGSTMLHYRVMGVRDDTVDVGYQADMGGVDWTWVVAEGDSLVRDSSYFAPAPGHGPPYSWSRRQNVPDTVAKRIDGPSSSARGASRK